MEEQQNTKSTTEGGESSAAVAPSQPVDYSVQSGIKEPGKKSKKKLLFILGGLTALVGIGVALLFLLYPTPEQRVQRALFGTLDNDSGRYQLDADVKIGLGFFNLEFENIDIAGAYQDQRMQLDYKLPVEDNKEVTGSLFLDPDDEKMYLKFKNLGDLFGGGQANPELTELEDKWFFVTDEDLSDYDELDENKIKLLRDIAKDYQFFNVEEVLDKKEIQGQNAKGYKLSVNTEQIKTYREQIEKNSELKDEEAVESFLSLLEGIEEMKASEVNNLVFWLKGSRLVGVDFDAEFEEEGFEIVLSLELYDTNKKIDLTPPSDAEEFKNVEELMTSVLFGGSFELEEQSTTFESGTFEEGSELNDTNSGESGPIEVPQPEVLQAE